MSVDAQRGELIKQAFEKAGFQVKNIPIEGDSYRLLIESIKGKGETMEIYKEKNSPLIVFSINIFLNPTHYEKYRNFNEQERDNFHKEIEEFFRKKNAKFETTEDEKGFGIWIHDEVDHNAFNNAKLHECYENVNNPAVDLTNMLNQFFNK